MNGYIIKQAISVGTRPRTAPTQDKALRPRPRLGRAVRSLGVTLSHGALRLTG